MQRLTENKIILVIRHTRLDELIQRFNTLAQARFYIEHSGADFAEYLEEHERYYEAVQLTESILQVMGRLQVVQKDFLPNFIFGPDDTVVVLGQDGLVVNTAKYLTSQPIIGVNPEPSRYDGVLLPFVARDLPGVMTEVFSKKRNFKEVTMAKASLNDGQCLYAINDLFIGPRSHTSARYTLMLGDQQEVQSSSGIIVSTGFGSTGWLTSIVTGASAIEQLQMGVEYKRPDIPSIDASWDMNYLYFSVREPFPSKVSSATLVYGQIKPDMPMVLTSQMPEHGVIFSDGVEKDFLKFNSGTIATITLAEKRARIVV